MHDFEGSRAEFLKILAEMGEEPAFLGRARAAEAALQTLESRCEKERLEALTWPRRHFQILRNRSLENWSRFTRLVSDADAESLFRELSEQLPPDAWKAEPWLASDRSALAAFLESAKRFNQWWTKRLDSNLLDDVNRRRQEYNRYYPIEKSCAFGSDVIASNFQPLPLLTRSWIEKRYPLLRLPTCR